MGLFRTGILRTTQAQAGIQVPDYIRYPQGNPAAPPPAEPPPGPIPGPGPVGAPPRPSTSPTPFGLGILALLGMIALAVAAKRSQEVGTWC